MRKENTSRRVWAYRIEENGAVGSLRLSRTAFAGHCHELWEDPGGAEERPA